jgi:hypothetical protein
MKYLASPCTPHIPIVCVCIVVVCSLCAYAAYSRLGSAESEPFASAAIPSPGGGGGGKLTVATAKLHKRNMDALIVALAHRLAQLLPTDKELAKQKKQAAATRAVSKKLPVTATPEQRADKKKKADAAKAVSAKNAAAQMRIAPDEGFRDTPPASMTSAASSIRYISAKYTAADSEAASSSSSSSSSQPGTALGEPLRIYVDSIRTWHAFYNDDVVVVVNHLLSGRNNGLAAKKQQKNTQEEGDRQAKTSHVKAGELHKHILDLHKK